MNTEIFTPDPESIKPKIDLNFVRKYRNGLLKNTDKLLLEDYPYPDGITKQDILSYRQLLRDLPNTINLTNVTNTKQMLDLFPTDPTATTE